MGKCKYPNKVCGNMVIYHGAAYCSAPSCGFQDDLINPTNADKIRAMGNHELAKFLTEKFCHGAGEDLVKKWLESEYEG